MAREGAKRLGFGLLAALAFMVATFGLWQAVYLPLSWRFARACLGAVIGFGVCRFFLARSGLVTLFVVHFPTDPDRLCRPSFWLWVSVCAAGVAALALVTL
ncbi:MAG: hypothetical protein AB7U65_10715 [Halothiobacillaceae bacterium]